MKVFSLILLALFFVAPTRSQDCDNTVADQTGAFSSGQVQEVMANAQGLINQGADVRVRTMGPTSNLDMDEKDLEKACRSWQSPNGGRKSTLVVLMVSPAGHKMGIYYGAAFSHALDNHWNRIKSDYMAPHFKTGDWAGGFVAAEQQLAARIGASKDEAVHPATNTTVNQAADFTGLWTFLEWGLALGVVIVGSIMLFGWLKNRRKQKQELREARQAAIDAKARASDLIGKSEKGPRYDTAVEEFSRLSSLVSSDPYAEDLEIPEYNAIARQYQKVVDMLRPDVIIPDAGKRSSKASVKSAKKESEKHEKQKTTDEQKVRTTTNIVNNEVGGMPYVIPVPIYEPEPERYREPERRKDPEPEPEPERHHKSSDDSGGGGSSSWSDSSSDSGGSSDFGGGDSGGGGGSSDF